MSTTTTTPPVAPFPLVRSRGRGIVDHVVDARQWMWWVYLVLVVVGGVLVVHRAVPYVRLAPVAVAIGLIFFAVLSAILLRILRAIDRFEIQPAGTIAAAFCWGVFAAPPIAYIAESSVGGFFPSVGLGAWGDALSAASIEEPAKLAGVIALLYLTRARGIRPIDGLVYGAIVGIAFEVTENLEYIAQGALTNPNSDLVGALAQGFARVLFGFGAHGIWAALTGLGAAYLLGARRSTVKRVLVVVATWSLAWAFHFVWDSPIGAGSGDPLRLIPYYLLAVLAFILAARLSRRTEKRWIRAVFADAPTDVVDVDDLDALTTHKALRQARKRARRAGGGAGKRAYLHLQHAQIVLAGMLRTRPWDDPRVLRQSDVVRRLRADAVAHGVMPLPRVAPGAEATAAPDSNEAPATGGAPAESAPTPSALIAAEEGAPPREISPPR